MGGCDIVRQMFNSGELHEALGVEPPDRTPPDIYLSDTAAALMRDALSEHPGVAVHLRIDANWQHGFNLGQVEGARGEGGVERRRHLHGRGHRAAGEGPVPSISRKA